MFNGPCLSLSVCVAFSDWTGDSLTMVSGGVCNMICLCASVDFFFLPSFFDFFLLLSSHSSFSFHHSFLVMFLSVPSFLVIFHLFHHLFCFSLSFLPFLSFIFLFSFFICLKLSQFLWSVGFMLHKSSLSLVSTFSFMFFHKALQCHSVSSCLHQTRRFKKDTVFHDILLMRF